MACWDMACWDMACWDMACWARSAVFVAVLISSSLPFWLLLGSVRLNGFGCCCRRAR
jgi:hypothetical protein